MKLFEGVMKKIFVLMALSLGTFSLQADGPVAGSCAASAAEQSFMDQLSDQNKKVFCAMSPEDRATCMQLAQTMDNYGNQMTPDQAIESMAVPGSCSAG